MSSSNAQPKEEDPSIEECATGEGLVGVLAQSHLIDPVPDDIVLTFDDVGIEPRSLVGKKLQSYWYFDWTLAHIVLKMTDGVQVVLAYKLKHDPFWDGNGEPELQLSDALETALQDFYHKDEFNTGSGSAKSLNIVAAVAGQKTSHGWGFWDGDIGSPDTQKHRVLGLRFEGKKEIGWISSGQNIWDSDIDCPHEITWADVVIAESAGRGPKVAPY